jgi:hypothetical protein
LSSTRKIVGSFLFEAVFRASQNSPSLVVPSPVVMRVTSSVANFGARAWAASTRS